MTTFGTNIDLLVEHEPPPAFRYLRMARCVLSPETALWERIAIYQRQNVHVLGVIAHESLGGRTYEQASQEYLDLAFAHGLHAIQVGNEPDVEGVSSWTLSAEEYSALLRAFIQRRGDRPLPRIVGAGVAGGDFYREIDLDGVDAVGIHLYGVSPRYGDLEFWREHGAPYEHAWERLTNFYTGGLPIWVTEYGMDERHCGGRRIQARWISEMSHVLADFRVEVAIQFCYTDWWMVPAATESGQPELVAMGLRDDRGRPKMAERRYLAAVRARSG